MPEIANSPPRCHIPWQEMNIDADGNVTPCCNWMSHGNTDNPYCGNAKTQSLMEIWNGEVYQRLRKYMALGDYEKSGCAKCTLILRGEKSPLRYDPETDAEITAAAESGRTDPVRPEPANTPYGNSARQHSPEGDADGHFGGALLQLQSALPALLSGAGPNQGP